MLLRHMLASNSPSGAERVHANDEERERWFTSFLSMAPAEPKANHCAFEMRKRP